MLPPTSAALADEATAIGVNPAGLTHLGGPELVYAHERAAPGANLDGLYLGTTLFDALGAGFSLEWLAEPGQHRRKTSYALSSGSAAVSLGAALNVYSSSVQDLDGLTSWDLGLTARPSRRVALGLSAHNIDAPGRGAVALGREYNLALGLRPFGERVTVGADWLFTDLLRARDGRLAYTLRAELAKGVLLTGGFSHGLGTQKELFAQVGLTLDTAHWGLTYTAANAPAGTSHFAAIRLSRPRYRSLLPVRKIAVLDLQALLSEPGNAALALLGLTGADPFLKTLRLLDDMASDPELAGVLLKVENTHLGMAKAQELFSAVMRLRERGKRVAALLLSADDAEYLVATAAERIYALPSSILLVDGFRASVVFLGGSMKKLGVHWDVARVGAYKNAPDPLTHEQMSAEQRLAIDAYLDADVRAFEAHVSSARAMATADVRQAIAEGLKTPARARDLRLIDEVVSTDGLDGRLVELMPGARVDRHYHPKAAREVRWGERKKIAVIPVLGTITGGTSRSEPFGAARIAGADTIVRALDEAAEDSSIAAIVVRVDSGGGDGLASDLIYRAVLKAKAKKPVVASMGDVAASGGYMAAMGAHEVFAEPTTLTGSIGVFALKPALRELAEKLGANQETVRRGDQAGSFDDFYSPWTAAQRSSVQRWVEAFYDDFIGEVARQRELSRARVNELGRGRVWSGGDAKSMGLVDELGGLAAAVASARERARLRPTEEIDLEFLGEPSGFAASMTSRDGVLARLLPAPTSEQPFYASVVRLGQELGFSPVALEGRVLAMMEFAVTVR